MDSCSSSAYASEESEGGGKFVFKVRDSSRVYKGKPEKLGGYGSLSPDGAESSTDDEHAPPRVRARDERRPLLEAETTQRALTAAAMPVMPAHATSLLPTTSPPDKPSSPLTQALVDSPKHRPATGQQSRGNQGGTLKKKKVTDSSSLVSSGSEDDHPLPLAKNPPPRHKRPDWRKPVGHDFKDGVRLLNNNGSPSVLPAKSHNAQVVLPDTPPAPEKDKQVVLPSSSSVAALKPGFRSVAIVRKYAVEAPFRRLTSVGPAQKGKRPATVRELREIKSMMRERALNTYEAKEGINRFEQLFTDKRYAHIDDRSKIEGLLGYVTPVLSKNHSDIEQNTYYEEVCRLYLLHPDANGRKAAETEIRRINGELEKREKNGTKKEKDDYRFNEMENLIWKLTPNQRHGLRKKFHGLYGNSVLRDDTNWMFFDTIIRSHTMDEDEQRELMVDMFSASKETRLDKRDELRSEIQGYLTRTQRDEVKRVCKERHNSILYSRLPLLQVIIMENNQEALEDYENTVLRFMHADEFFKLFDCRSRTLGANPTFTGDGAFFTMAQWGSIDMMLHFLSFILTDVTLCGMEKTAILESFRQSDRASAFHMVLAAGDYDRVKAILMHFNLLLQQLENPFGIPKFKFNDPTVVSFSYSESIALICGDIIGPSMDDPSREYRVVNGYTNAIDNGHIKCARMYRKLLRNNWRFYIDTSREFATTYNKVYFKPNGDRFDKDVRKAIKDEKKSAKELTKNYIKLFPDVHEREKEMQRLHIRRLLIRKRADNARAKDEKILKDRENMKKNGRPISMERTTSERMYDSTKRLFLQTVFAKAHLSFTVMDDNTGFINRLQLKRQKRIENPSPLQSAIKAMTPLFTPNGTGTPKSETKPRKVPKYIARPESFTPSRFIENKLPKNPDGSPKPRTGKWYGEDYELKKLKKQAKQDSSTTPGKQGYTKFDDESEGA